MRIVHFISHFPYSDQLANPARTERYVCSGGEWAAFHLVSELAKAGHSVEVVTSSAGHADEREQRDGFLVRRYGSRFKIGETLMAPGMFFRPTREMDVPDIVHIHHTTPPGGMAGLACNRQWTSPLVVTHHGFEKPDSYGSLIRRIAVLLSANMYVGRLLGAASRIICISPVFPAQSRHLGRYSAKTVIIPNGVAPAEFHTGISQADARAELGLAESRRYGLFLGSLIPPKGLGILLQAMLVILRACPDFLLLVAGRGSGSEMFRRQARDLGVTDSVRFEGFVADARRKLMYYRASDVLIQPSVLSEMFPLVLLEGAAAGCATVASDLEIFRWFFTDHVDGIVVPAGDAEWLGAAIVEILMDGQLRKRLSDGAQRRAEGFSWPAIARQTAAVYAALLAERAGGGGS
jgi:glycosyltransferase involved in cell wall biosynthesis